MLVRK